MPEPAGSVNAAIAWIGALTGCASLGWNVYTWLTKGPRVIVTAHHGMVYIGAGFDQSPRINVTVVNRGDAPTTINNLIIWHFPSRLRAWRCRPDTPALVVNDFGVSAPPPFVLTPGDEWKPLTLQAPLDTMVVDHGWRGYLYFVVFHTMSTKPVLARLRLPTLQRARSSGE